MTLLKIIGILLDSLVLKELDIKMETLRLNRGKNIEMLKYDDAMKK